MYKLLSILLLIQAFAYGEVINTYPTQEFLDSGIKIIDIRTEAEWKETGIIKGAIPLTFFDERGNYDVYVFMMNLRKQIKKGEKFALICHVGSRTSMVADFLDKEYKMQVINLLGGMDYLHNKAYKTVPYKAP
ncbi:rhodanese-like domain-containing protein [Sulfurimonas sp. MAG313]|nr:rhodanese-like domain-containing protein [Sulfurimonas sp. MAG313]MDF1880227.1 rhodanese-like domain-containing protein [Sulfurimonas sp. MAG313]